MQYIGVVHRDCNGILDIVWAILKEAPAKVVYKELPQAYGCKTKPEDPDTLLLRI